MVGRENGVIAMCAIGAAASGCCRVAKMNLDARRIVFETVDSKYFEEQQVGAANFCLVLARLLWKGSSIRRCVNESECSVTYFRQVLSTEYIDRWDGGSIGICAVEHSTVT